MQVVGSPKVKVRSLQSSTAPSRRLRESIQAVTRARRKGRVEEEAVEGMMNHTRRTMRMRRRRAGISPALGGATPVETRPNDPKDVSWVQREPSQRERERGPHALPCLSSIWYAGVLSPLVREITNQAKLPDTLQSFHVLQSQKLPQSIPPSSSWRAFIKKSQGDKEMEEKKTASRSLLISSSVIVSFLLWQFSA